MGFLDLFKRQPTTPVVISILPDIAKQEIRSGRLPILNTNSVFLKHGENCHYIDKAIYEKRTVNKRYVRRNQGYSVPGFFKGTRINIGSGKTDVVDNETFDTYRGVLYITNKRMIFVSDTNGFEKKLESIVAITPYTNCVEIQLAKETLKIFVSDGYLLKQVLHLI